MKIHKGFEKYPIQERIRRNALRDGRAYTYYRLSVMLKVKDIEDRELYNKGRAIEDRLLVEDFLKMMEGKERL